MGRRMARSDPRREPTFFWQGALIVLPVVLLSAVGLISLRKDKALARLAAVERAHGLAEELASRIWSRLPEETSNGARWFQVDVAGALLFPPPYRSNPEPQPCDLAELDATQVRLWQQARREETDLQGKVAALGLYQDFLASRPPQNFLASAHYATGLMLANGGNPQGAAEQFRLVIEKFPDARGESGVPLGALAQLKLAKLQAQTLTNGPSVDFDAICSNWVYHPSAITAELLGQIADVSLRAREVAGKWQHLWREQEESRELFAIVSRRFPAAGAFWFKVPELDGLESGDENWLAVGSRNQSTNATFVCRTESELGLLVSNLVAQTRGLPDYFAVNIELAGRKLSQYAPDLRVWAPASGLTQGVGPAGKMYSAELANDILASARAPEALPDGLRVSILLTSPQALFKLEATRRFWFGLLIAVAAVAALAGFVAAYRAFHRQLRLSELKSNFVSSVSHELRAPIASVRLLAESLERGKISEAPKQQEYFHFIVQECRRLSSLIENVLDFSRIEQGRKQYEFEPTDLVELTRQTVKLMQTHADERQVTLTLAIAELPLSNPDAQPSLDGKAIQQALVNLIDNAIKYSPKGGRVTVGLEILAQDSEEVNKRRSSDAGSRLQQRGSRVLLWVEDQGEGIPTLEHEKIFERFYRRGSELRRQTQGVGIGLSIVKHIVEAHGGRVLVNSEPGKGSRFTIVL
jgi:signal transduction histidine kinase